MSALCAYVAAVQHQRQLLFEAVRRDRDARLYLKGSIPQRARGERRKSGRRVWTRLDKRLVQLEVETRQVDEFNLNLERFGTSDYWDYLQPSPCWKWPMRRLHSRLYRVWHRWPAPDHRAALAEVAAAQMYGVVAPLIVELSEAYADVREWYRGEDEHEPKSETLGDAETRFQRAVSTLELHCIRMPPVLAADETSKIVTYMAAKPTSKTDINESQDAAADYLDAYIDRENRTVTRKGKVVSFGRKDRTWKVFVTVFGAGAAGLTREELRQCIWGDAPCNENNLDQQKSKANVILADHNLGLEIAADRRGIWSVKATV